VISSSGAEAKAVKTDRSTIHICYCHSPTQYYWRRYEEYAKSPGFGYFDWLARIGLKLFIKPMRRWDKRAAQKPDYLIANSTFTQTEIKRCYGRDSTVIHPPVDVDRYKITGQKRSGFVTAGRQTPYKRTDLAIKACAKLGLNLTVLGDGPDHKRLEELAGPTTTFLTNVSDHDMAHYFETSEACIFPVIEDFGIVAVEAMAAGTPVIAYQAGGALDFIKESETGLFFPEQTVASLKKVLKDFSSQNFNHDLIRQHSEQFDIKHFKKKMSEFVSSIVAQ
jgi:glycosyltransferase involved in cell wall biosynthesis